MADSAEQRDLAQSFVRAKELQLDPIKGNFDQAHLQAVHRHIFQDQPHHKPGEFREPAPGHFKHRRLEESLTGHVVPYALRSTLDRELGPLLTGLEGGAKLAGKDTLAMAGAMADLYAKLDHLHPFSEGNSRTLRAFTSQLAAENGHKLDWNTTNANRETRNALYIARDMAVIREHFPGIEPRDTATTTDRERMAGAMMLAQHEHADPLKELIRVSLERGLEQQPHIKTMTREEITRQHEFSAPTALKQAERGHEETRIAELRGKASKDDLQKAERTLELAKMLSDPKDFRAKMDAIRTDELRVRFNPGEGALSRLAGVSAAVDRELQRQRDTGRGDTDRQAGRADPARSSADKPSREDERER